MISINKPYTVDMTPKNESKDFAANWWSESDNLHDHVFALVRQLDQNFGNSKNNEDTRNLRLYSNRQYISLNLQTKQRQQQKTMPDAARLTLNVIKSCIDTAAAKISKSKPRPQFVTSGGDYKLKRKSKQLTKYLDGLFASADAYAIAQQCFVDSCIFGTGVMKILVQDDKIVFERVLKSEILIDESEAYYGQPRQIHQTRYMSKHTLAQLFPEHAAVIANADTSISTSDAANVNICTVVESWHLRSSSTATDGRRTICISNATLLDEAYEQDHFPFAFLRWSQLPVGFFGMGLAEELTGIQIEINKILRNIQAAQNINSVPRVFIESGSITNSSSLQANPEGLSVVRYTGGEPKFLTASAMPAEIYSHLDRLVNKAYEITGISQLSASSVKPAGLDSGVALREYQDIESERFVLAGQRWEDFFITVAKISIALSKQLFESNPKLNVKIATKGNLEKISWKDVHMDEDEYIMRCFPTSILPTLPAGRLQTVQELIQAGFIEKDEGMNLLDFPDLERSLSLNNAAVDDVMMIIEKIVEDGEYTTPEPYFNLEMCVKLAQGQYLKARQGGVDEDKLELLRRFIDDSKVLLQPAPAPLAQPQALANPEPLPQSDLIPQVMPQ
jgi:hypothetical protein